MPVVEAGVDATASSRVRGCALARVFVAGSALGVVARFALAAVFVTLLVLVVVVVAAALRTPVRVRLLVRVSMMVTSSVASAVAAERRVRRVDIAL